MDGIFGKDAVTEAPEVEVSTPDTDAKKQKLKMMKEVLKETINSEPGFTDNLRRLSNSLKVVKTLGYGKTGNVKVDKEVEKASGDRKLVPTSQIVGYRIQNIGTEAIEYETEEYKQDASGKFVGTRVTKTLKAGDSCDLTREYMTKLCSRPEISFTLVNGKITSSSRKAKTIKEELSAYYFSFNKAEDGTTIQVNDDEVKVSIDKDGVVLPEFVETFGYLNNPKEAKSKEKGSKFTTQDLAANYVRKLLEKQGV